MNLDDTNITSRKCVVQKKKAFDVGLNDALLFYI